MTLFVPIIICSLCIFVESIHSDIIESIVKSTCGERKNCSEGGNANLPLDTCCRPCECGDICFEKRTCCPDRYAYISENETKQVCLPSVSYNKPYKDHRQFPSYFVRAYCPETFQGETTRRKCEQKETESILDIPFVSSKDGSVVYKNRHCAACFDELDIVPWTIKIDWSCITNIYLDDDGNKLGLNQTFLTYSLLKQCTFEFVRPKSTNWKHTFCYEEDRLISSCPAKKVPGSGFQNTVYEKLKKKCKNDKSALTFIGGKSSFGYSNIYCYLCNKGSETIGTCNTEEPFKGTPAFLFLLRTETVIEKRTESVIDTDDKTDERHICDQYEYHDKFFGVCRILQCPVLRFSKQGKCVQLVHQRYSKINFKFDVKLSSTEQVPQNDTDVLAFAKQLPNLMQKYLQFQNCKICSMRVLREKRNASITEIYTSFIFVTTSKCVGGKILSTAATLQDNQKVSKNKIIKWKQIQYKVEYISSEEAYRKLFKILKQYMCLDSTSASTCSRLDLKIVHRFIFQSKSIKK